jgi:hypothetical protein
MCNNLNNLNNLKYFILSDENILKNIIFQYNNKSIHYGQLKDINSIQSLEKIEGIEHLINYKNIEEIKNSNYNFNNNTFIKSIIDNLFPNTSDNISFHLQPFNTSYNLNNKDLGDYNNSTSTFSKTKNNLKSEYKLPLKKPILVFENKQKDTIKKRFIKENPCNTYKIIQKKRWKDNDEITNDEIPNNEISNNEISNNEISNNEISNNEISNDEISNDEIPNYKLESDNEVLFKNINIKEDLSENEVSPKSINIKENLSENEVYPKSINIKEDLSENEVSPKNIIKQNNIIIKNNTFVNKLYIPREFDKLFWCFYIIKNGNLNYECLTNKNTLITQQLKIEYIYKLRDNKKILKNFKFDTLTNIENNLVNEKVINIKTFFSLCLIENINVIFVNENKKYYYEFIIDTNIPIYIVYLLVNDIHFKNSNNLSKYGFIKGDICGINNIRNNYYKIENINKYIKCISNYKVNELKEIAKKLGINIAKSNKKELYEEINKFFI